MPSWRRSKIGLTKSSIWITHEICEGSISLTLRTRSSKKPFRMLVRNRKHQWLLLCRVKLWRKIVGVVDPTNWNTNCVYYGSWWIYKIAHRWRFTTALQFGSLIYSYASSCENSCSESSGGQGMWKNWRRFRRGTWRKSEVRNRWSMKQGRRAQKFTLHHWWTCNLKNAELEADHQKYKVRVVLRGDIVTDDSGSHAVFTEQGSSASQMTAVKIKDIISRLPGCDGQAADVVSAYIQLKMEDDHKLLKIPKSWCPDIWIRLPRHKWRNHGPVWKTQLFFLSGICTVILWQDYYWKGNWRKSFWNMAGRKFQIKKGFFLTVYVDDIEFDWKTKHWSEKEINQQRSRFGRTNIFLGSWILGVHSTTMWNGKTEPCSNREFQLSEQKTSTPSKCSCFFLVFWHGWSRKEVERFCELANKTTQQLYKVSTPCIYDHHFKEEEMKSVGELSHVCSQIVHGS